MTATLTATSADEGGAGWRFVAVGLLETAERRWLGYAEGQKTGQLISDREAVSVMQMRYAKMRSQALSPADSMELLRRMRGTR